MKVVSFVCAALSLGALVGACAAPSAGVPALAATALPVAVDGRKTRVTFTLPNGVTAILEENHVTPVVALQVWIGAGASAEPAGQGGLAHLTERVVLGGAPGDDAAPITAWTSFDATVFETVVAAPLAPARVDALGALLARAAFAAPEVQRARGEVGGELRRAAASSAAVTTAALFGVAFPGHAYGRPALGAEASLGSLTAADVAAFHARAYAGGNVTVVVVGDLDVQALRGRVAAAFSALPKGPTPARVPAPALEGPRAAVVAAEGGEGRLGLGFRFAASDAEELAAVDVLAAALASGGAGRLPRELVLNRQLASAAHASVFHGRDGGLLALDVPLVAGRSEEAARVALAEVARAAGALAPDELEAARLVVEADLARAEESPAGYARRLGFFATVAGDAAFGERYLARLRALTPAREKDLVSPLVRAANVAVAAAAPAGVAPARGADDAAARLRALVAGGGAAPARAAPAPLAVTARGDVVRVVLPSGLRILVLRDPTAAAVSAQAIWAGGLRLEDARSNGVTGLLAATLPRATRTRDAARLAAELRALGGTLSASAGRDELGLAATFLARRWEDGLELLADCLLHPSFPEDVVERARRVALERVRDHEDDADLAAARLYAATLWPGHPYRLPLLGTAASLSALTRRRLADHFAGHYSAANLTIAVVGDVDAARVVEKLRALFSDAPAPLVAAPPPAAPPPRAAAAAPTEVFAVAAHEQAHVVVGYPGLALRDPERRAGDVLVAILGGADGRLARELGGVSLVDAAAWSGVDGGALVFDLASTPAAVDDAVASLRASLGRVAAGAFSPAEVARARDALVSADARALASRPAVAAALARDEALGLPAGAYRRAAAELAAVTPEGVARVARRLVDPRLEIVAVVRPPAPPAVAKAPPQRLAARPASPAAPAPLPSTSGGRRPAAP